jgi:hypothetical protein
MRVESLSNASSATSEQQFELLEEELLSPRAAAGVVRSGWSWIGLLPLASGSRSRSLDLANRG